MTQLPAGRFDAWHHSAQPAALWELQVVNGSIVFKDRILGKNQTFMLFFVGQNYTVTIFQTKFSRLYRFVILARCRFHNKTISMQMIKQRANFTLCLMWEFEHVFHSQIACDCFTKGLLRKRKMLLLHSPRVSSDNIILDESTLQHLATIIILLYCKITILKLFHS